MLIKHLVLPGGGPVFFTQISTLQQLEKKKILIRENIKTIFATSGGCVSGVLYALSIKHEILNNYLIERHWQDLFTIKPKNMMEIYYKKGLLDIYSIYRKGFKSLFEIKDLNLNINLEDFYNFCGIEINFITFDLNEFKILIINHKNYPKLELLKVLSMSSAIPLLYYPIFLDNKCLIDGGITSNYPLQLCVNYLCENSKYNEIVNILGLKNHYYQNNNNNIIINSNENNISNNISNINENSNLMNYLILIIRKVFQSLNNEDFNYELVNEVTILCETMTYYSLKNCINNKNTRISLINNGIQNANEFNENYNMKLNDINICNM